MLAKDLAAQVTMAVNEIDHCPLCCAVFKVAAVNAPEEKDDPVLTCLRDALYWVKSDPVIAPIDKGKITALDVRHKRSNQLTTFLEAALVASGPSPTGKDADKPEAPTVDSLPDDLTGMVDLSPVLDALATETAKTRTTKKK